jgi:hypothetical protein
MGEVRMRLNVPLSAAGLNSKNERISEPRLPIQIYTPQEIMSTKEFRKYFAFPFPKKNP